MPLEAGTTISDLDSSWPLVGDAILQGDDHLRLIKAVLKAQFPGDLGQGLAIPIIATEEELNWLTGLTGNIQAQLDAIVADDALMAPTGTVLTFFNPAPPTGWTPINTVSDAMLRIIDNTNTGGVTGGSDSAVNPDLGHVHSTSGHNLSIAEMPIHSHSGVSEWVGGGGDGNTTGGANIQNNGSTNDTGSGAAHSHGNTGNSGANIWNPKYANFIIASKD